MSEKIIVFPKKIGVTAYTPEMGDKKPLADIEATISYSGKWRIKTRLELKGRGIKFHDKTEDERNIYYLTDTAFKKLETQYAISMECLLD